MQQCQFPDSNESNTKLYWGIRESCCLWQEYLKKLVATGSDAWVERLASDGTRANISEVPKSDLRLCVPLSEATTVSDRSLIES